MKINWGEIINKASNAAAFVGGNIKEGYNVVKDKVTQAVNNYKEKQRPIDTLYGEKVYRDTGEKVPMPPLKAGVSTPTPIPNEVQKIIPPSVTPTPSPTVTVGGQGRNPNYDKQTIQPKVSSAINKASSLFNVPSDLLFDLSFSESSHIPDKVNPDAAPGLNPTGLFQFTDNTWNDVLNYARSPNSSLYGVLPNEDRKDPETNALAAAYLISYGQLGKWDASEWNWGDYWTPKELEDAGFYDQSLYHTEGLRPSKRLSQR